MARLNNEELDRALTAFADAEQVRGPSVRELQQALGLSSTSLVKKRIERLEERGLVERIPEAKQYETRQYRLTRQARALLRERYAIGEFGALPESGGGW